MSTRQVNLHHEAIEPELAEHWWLAIAAAGAAIDAAEVDGDLAAAQAGARRRALIAERCWLEGVSGRYTFLPQALAASASAS